jgi:dihydrodipicolinate synthase/N-acetylneuraminate lyase
MKATVQARRSLLAQLFPHGVPKLWCPLLTHYTAEGAIDRARMEAHLAHLAPHVKGLLAPGSTGDGWELTENESREVVQIVLSRLQAFDLHLLIGLLKSDLVGVIRAFLDLGGPCLPELPTYSPDALAARLSEARVCGFAVCPPHGHGLEEERIRQELAGMLDLGFPAALYQLPQVTQNEMSAGLVSGLARRFANFIMFKDSSGADRVALAGHDASGVVFVRGAEGSYARWLKATGGPYDGFLLSSANCFAAELREIIDDLLAGHTARAHRLSAQLSAVVNDAFDAVKGLAGGNAFANANKALDHFFAHGPKAAAVPAPRLHCGSRLPSGVIAATEKALERHGFLPRKGYLE